MDKPPASGDTGMGRERGQRRHWLLSEFSTLIYENTGIRFSEEKQEQLSIKLEKLLKSRDTEALDGLYRSLRAGDRRALDSLIGAVTVNHTFFFREKEHFLHLVEAIRERKITSPLIWCAASATGEEPYTLAMCLLEAGIRDFRIIASDIDRGALAETHRGEYPAASINDLPDRIRMTYFLPSGPGMYKVRPDLRARLVVKRINIMEEFDFERTCDIIFCRNVLIYFDEQSRKRAVRNLAANLKPGGFLFLGHTETLLDCPPGLVRESHAMFRKAWGKRF